MGATPILMLGAGRMGGALIEGWRASGAIAAAELMIREPAPGPAAEAAAREGARLNPPDAALAQARTVLLAVKPQIWREAAAEVAPWLHNGAVIVSVAAGVRAGDIEKEFGGRCVARVMPTIAAAVGRGTATIYAEEPEARARAHALFAPVGAVVDLTDERLMHAATAVSGSAPAYLYALVETLEAAGVASGLSAQAAADLARSTIVGAAALLGERPEPPSELRRQVTSPGGTTEAALKVLLAEAGFPGLLREAVQAAVRRSKEMAAA